MDDKMTWTTEFDLTPEQAAALRSVLVDERTYPCEGCDCGRSMLVCRVSGGFDLTLIDPEFEAYMPMTAAELAEWLAYAEGDGLGECWVSEDIGNEGSIVLTDAQLADLRAWALIGGGGEHPRSGVLGNQAQTSGRA